MSHSLADVITPRTTVEEVHKVMGQAGLSEADYGTTANSWSSSAKAKGEKAAKYLYCLLTDTKEEINITRNSSC